MSRPLTFAAEAGRQLRRRRTAWAFGLLAALPVVVWIAFALGGGSGGGSGGGGSSFVDLAQTGSGNFTVFVLAAATNFLFVILAALFAGDAVPSEAAWSSLRYLLVAPVGRGRLLASKLAVAVASTVAAVVLLPAISLLVGGLAYGWAPFVSLGGAGLDWPTFLPRLALAVAVVAVTMLQVVGIAFAIGTVTDAPLGAVGGAVLVVIVAGILDSIDALGDLRQGLPMHFSFAWLQAFSGDVGWTDIERGVAWSLLYAVVGVLVGAWRFGRKDVLS